MMPYKVTVLHFGRVEQQYAEAVRYYDKRLRGLARFQLRQTTHLPAPPFILLDERGRAMDSDDFTEMLRKRAGLGNEIVFVVGGAEGVKMPKPPLETISLSPLTLQNTLALVVLLEQIYRALLRIKGVDYHK